MNYQLIAMDMDGTLIRTKGEISEENRRCIRLALEAGKKVVLATGRSIMMAFPFTEQLGLDSPMVINNGSEVWRTPTVLHRRHLLEPASIRRVLDLIGTYGEQVSYTAHTVGGRLDINNTPGDLSSVQWLQFNVLSKNYELLEEIRRELVSWNMMEISSSGINNVECNPHGINKASGLKEICELLSVPIEQAIAIGDGLNDIPMIRAAGLGVAMGNARESVKQAADVVAPTNFEDGVAHVIKTYLL